jgi:uncharacterized protein with FMN-binding domain
MEELITRIQEVYSDCTMKYYVLSDVAEMQYRSNSKRCKRMNFKREIIEKRLNAMISISKDIVYFSDSDFEAGIFSCIIIVKQNQIYGIRWCNESHHSKTNKKILESLKEAYQRYGLNKCGERMADLAS